MHDTTKSGAITGLILAALLACSLPASADDAFAGSGHWRGYDASGRYAGTAYRVAPDRVRLYDAKGRYAGTAYRRSGSSWRVYDGSGRFTGTVTERRR